MKIENQDDGNNAAEGLNGQEPKKVGDEGKKPAETKNTAADDINVEKVIAARLDAIKKDAIEEAKKELAEQAEKKAKEEQGQFEPLYKAERDKVVSLESEVSTLKAQIVTLESAIDVEIQARVKQLPQDIVDLLPSKLDKLETLEWLSKAASKHQEGRLNFHGENPRYGGGVDEKKMLADVQSQLASSGLYQN